MYQWASYFIFVGYICFSIQIQILLSFYYSHMNDPKAISSVQLINFHWYKIRFQEYKHIPNLEDDFLCCVDVTKIWLFSKFDLINF